MTKAGGLSGAATAVKPLDAGVQSTGAPQAGAGCYIPAMSDRLFLALIAAAGAVMIAFAMVWPQGLGARSPWPFGHTPVQQTPAMRAAMAREAAQAAKEYREKASAASPAARAPSCRALGQARHTARRQRQPGLRRPAARRMSDFDAIAVGRRVLAVEADALGQLAASLGEPFVQAVETLFRAKGRIVCSGMGKSGHVARKIAATLSSTGTPALFVHPGEASHGDLGMIGQDDVVLALSKTGETRELADILAYAKRFAIPVIAITAVEGSALGRAADIVLLLPNAAEAADALNAPTTSTTLQLALGDALAVALLERRGFTARDFRLYHPGGKLGAMLRTVGDLMHGPGDLPLVSPETPMAQAIVTMSEKRFGCVGVCADDGRLLGVITDGDIRRHIDGLLDHTAGEVMTHGPKTSPASALAAEALKRMTDEQPATTVLFVVEQGRPIGILHVHDLLRAGVM